LKKKQLMKAGEKVKCETCDKLVRRGDILVHKKSKAHIEKLKTL